MYRFTYIYIVQAEFANNTTHNNFGLSMHNVYLLLCVCKYVCMCVRMSVGFHLFTILGLNVMLDYMDKPNLRKLPCAMTHS